MAAIFFCKNLFLLLSEKKNFIPHGINFKFTGHMAFEG